MKAKKIPATYKVDEIVKSHMNIICGFTNEPKMEIVERYIKEGVIRDIKRFGLERQIGEYYGLNVPEDKK